MATTYKAKTIEWSLCPVSCLLPPQRFPKTPLKPSAGKSFLGERRPRVGRKGNMNSIPNPASIAPSASDSDAVALPSRLSMIRKEERCSDRRRVSFLAAVRALVRRLVDDSAYHEVSLRREISVIFTANGPLIYQPRANDDVRNEQARSSRK
jgi:hypothetical protein